MTNYLNGSSRSMSTPLPKIFSGAMEVLLQDGDRVVQRATKMHTRNRCSPSSSSVERHLFSPRWKNTATSDLSTKSICENIMRSTRLPIQKHRITRGFPGVHPFSTARIGLRSTNCDPRAPERILWVSITGFSLECRRSINAPGILNVEFSRDAVVSHKECIYAVRISAYECVSLCLCKGDECREARAVVVRFVPGKRGIVGNHHGRLIRNAGVVFHNHDAGRIVRDCLPYPVIIAIDVDPQQIALLRHIVRGEE